MDLAIKDDRVQGTVTRDMCAGETKPRITDAVILTTGDYGSVFLLSANVMGCNGSAVWDTYEQGAYFGDPCYTQIHPTYILQHGDFQSKLTLVSKSLRNDGRTWVPEHAEGCPKDPRDIPEKDRNYCLRRIYPSFSNLMSRNITSR